MGNKFPSTFKSDQQQCRDQWDEANASVALGRSLEASLLNHSCQEEEIVIEGEPLIVVKNCLACFSERRNRVPLTLAENLEKISAGEAVVLLENSKFRFTQHWQDIARRLDVKPEVRSKCELKIYADNNYNKAMEECLDWWIQNDSNASWERLLEAVAFYELATREKMRKSLGLYSTDIYNKLKKTCGEEFIIRLSKMLQPRHYAILAPYLLSEAAETVINEQEQDEILKVLRMLQHWKGCWKEKATYEALVCVAKCTLPSEPEIVKFAMESLLDSTLAHLPSEGVSDFHDIMNEEEQIAHQEKFMAIKKKFARVFSIGATFIIDTPRIDFRRLKYFASPFCPQLVEADNKLKLMDLVAIRISWFDYEMFESLIMEFGDNKHKQEFTAYKTELSKFLNQSILNIPRNISSQLQLAEIHNLPKVFIKIPLDESEIPSLYGSDVKNIKKLIARYIGLSDVKCINFIEYRKGCIELVFSLFQKPKGICNIVWDEERQEYKITGEIGKLLPESFCKRASSLASIRAAKSMLKSVQEEKLSNEVGKEKSRYTC